MNALEKLFYELKHYSEDLNKYEHGDVSMPWVFIRDDMVRVADATEPAAAELAALVTRLEQAEAERDVYRKGYEAAQKYAESLPRDVRAGFFIGGHDVIVSLIEYNKVTVDTLKMAFARVLSGKAAE